MEDSQCHEVSETNICIFEITTNKKTMNPNMHHVFDIILRTPDGRDVCFQSNMVMMDCQLVNTLCGFRHKVKCFKGHIFPSDILIGRSIVYGGAKIVAERMMIDPDTRPDIDSLEEIFSTLSRSVWSGPRRTFVVHVPFPYEVVKVFVCIKLLYTYGYMMSYVELLQIGRNEPFTWNIKNRDYFFYRSSGGTSEGIIEDMSNEMLSNVYNLAVYLKCFWIQSQMIHEARKRNYEF